MIVELDFVRAAREVSRALDSRPTIFNQILDLVKQPPTSEHSRSTIEPSTGQYLTRLENPSTHSIATIILIMLASTHP